MGNSSNVTVADPATYDGYLGVSSTTTVIGILGGVGSVLGVLVLLASAALLDAEDFAGTGYGLIANVFIQFLTLFGTSSSFYIFSQAADKTNTGFYILSFSSVLLMLYAQVLLYCTSLGLTQCTHSPLYLCTLLTVACALWVIQAPPRPSALRHSRARSSRRSRPPSSSSLPLPSRRATLHPAQRTRRNCFRGLSRPSRSPPLLSCLASVPPPCPGLC